MKALALAVLAVLVVTQVIHPKRSVQRTPAESKAWADWFTEHRDGGGV